MTELTLYDYAASGNCYKVRLLLGQLGRDYERIAVDIFDGDTLTDEFAALNPHRSTPVLVLPDGRPLIESNAILWYLAAGTSFLPDDPVGQAEICRWLIYEQTDVMPMIGGLRFRLLTGRFAPDSKAARRRLAGAHEVLGMLDRHLGDRPFLAADRYTIAAIAVFAYSHVAEEAGVETGPYRRFRDWLGRVAAQPGFVDDLALSAERGSSRRPLDLRLRERYSADIRPHPAHSFRVIFAHSRTLHASPNGGEPLRATDQGQVGRGAARHLRGLRRRGRAGRDRPSRRHRGSGRAARRPRADPRGRAGDRRGAKAGTSPLVARPERSPTDTIDVQLPDWNEAIALIAFLDGRGLRAFPVPDDMADGSSLIRVVCPVPAAADVEAFGALHAFLDSGTSEKLILRTGGRTFTMRRRREELAELSRG